MRYRPFGSLWEQSGIVFMAFGCPPIPLLGGHAGCEGSIVLKDAPKSSTPSEVGETGLHLTADAPATRMDKHVDRTAVD